VSETKIVMPVEVYSRVVGYYRPLNQWHKGKQSEWKDRTVLHLDNVNKFITGVRNGQSDGVRD